MYGVICIPAVTKSPQRYDFYFIYASACELICKKMPFRFKNSLLFFSFQLFLLPLHRNLDSCVQIVKILIFYEKF